MSKLLFPILFLFIVSCSEEEDVIPDDRIEITFQRTMVNSFYTDSEEIDTVMVAIDGNLAKESNLYDFNYSILNSETKEKTYYYLNINADTCYYILPDTMGYKMQELKDEKEILGYKCKKAIFTSVRDTITTYYTDQLPQILRIMF